MKKLLRIVAAAILGAGLVGGVAGASQATIDTSGADSTNNINFNDTVEVDVESTNNTLGVVANVQDAASGDAEATRNTDAGNVSTGNASNSASTSANVSSSNTGVAGWANWGASNSNHSATMNKTGADSTNRINFENSHELDVEVENNTAVIAITAQRANSGDATSSRNTDGGGASTGNASNTASTTVVISSNN